MYNIFKLSSTRVWRTYSGGRELERWHGEPDPADSDMPEDWIASTTRARNPGREHITDEGLSYVQGLDKTSLKDLIDHDPAGYLGAAHAGKYGSNLAFLTKLIDSSGRLTIQTHPDKAFSREVFHSDYGKTEAWYMLGGREVDGQQPYVLLGFKPGITREIWRDLFLRQDIPGMIDALHKVPVRPGDIFIINGGVPHAIGSGCFLVEIQEPTDYTLRVERTTPEGLEIADLLIHQGAGIEKMLDAFHYDGFTEEEMLKRWKVQPERLGSSEASSQYSLIGSGQTDYFAMKKLEIRTEHTSRRTGAFCVAIVQSGRGQVHSAGSSLAIRQGDFLFVPAGVTEMKWVNEGGSLLEIIGCFPPQS